jgi:hypothetical protein
MFLKEKSKMTPISFENRRWEPLFRIIFSEKIINKGEGDGQNDYANFVQSDITHPLLAAIQQQLTLSFKLTGSKKLVCLIHVALSSYGSTFPYIDFSRYLFLHIFDNHIMINDIYFCFFVQEPSYYFQKIIVCLIRVYPMLKCGLKVKMATIN